MAKDTPTNPGQAFQEMITKWERSFDSLANRVMGTEDYSKLMNQFQDMQLKAGKGYQDFMASQLNSANMPTRDDVIRIREGIHELSNRLDKIETMLSSLTAPSAGAAPTPRKGPPRTRKPAAAAASAPKAKAKTRTRAPAKAKPKIKPKTKPKTGSS